MGRVFFLQLWLVLVAASLFQSDAFAQSRQRRVKLDLDLIIDWNKLSQLTLDSLLPVLEKLPKSGGEHVYSIRRVDDVDRLPGIHVEFTPRSDFSYILSLFQNQLQFQAAIFKFRGDGSLYTLHLNVDYSELKTTTPELVTECFTKVSGGASPTTSSTNEQRWIFEKSDIRVSDRNPKLYVNCHFFSMKPPSGTPPIPQPSQPESLSANLDSLLNFAALWNLSADDFEKNYTPKAAKQEDQKKPPQFEWLNTDKTRARFSRQMFSNVETKLSMFAGSIKVEEAVVEFVNGKAARSTISFYNRGDSGDIAVADFERIFKTIGQGLGQVLKVAPKRQLNSANAALPVTGWMWTSPQAIALLEYNEYNTPGRVTKPEFLRLKLAAPSQADFTMGKMVTGVQSMELAKRVTKGTEGDIYITGVPMVDQGAKGYCVAASCQRLFEYLRIPCDQHEMAQLVNVDAESGANIFAMQKSLAKIDERFKVAFKPLVNPTLYYSNNGKRRVSEKEFTSLVKEYANKGIPLLWALELGKAVEIPPLPGSGQTGGGHMRMIIGYNDAKKQILFTDSWGAGHELKRMALLDAYDVTIGLFSMAPRGL